MNFLILSLIFIRNRIEVFLIIRIPFILFSQLTRHTKKQHPSHSLSAVCAAYINHTALNIFCVTVFLPEVLSSSFLAFSKFSIRLNSPAASSSPRCVYVFKVTPISLCPISYQFCQLNYPPFFAVDHFPQSSQTQKIREPEPLSKQSQLSEILCFIHFFSSLFFNS